MKKIALILFMFLGKLNAQFINHNIMPSYCDPIDSRMIDIDNDGGNDIVTLSLSGEIKWYEQTSQKPTFLPHVIQKDIGEFNETQNLAAVDLDQDGDVDILTITHYPLKELRWYKNNGDQVFEHVNIVLPSSFWKNYRQILTRDIDFDGDLDIIFDDRNIINILRNDGNQNFILEEAFRTDRYIFDYKIVDLNQDNKLDFVLTYEFGFSLFHQNDQGKFPEFILEKETKTSIDIGDIDNDGDIDIVAAGGSSGEINFYLNSGDHYNFEVIPKISKGTQVNLRDMDADGDLDLVYISGTLESKNNEFNVIKNNNTKSFDKNNQVSLPGKPNYIWNLLVEDFDGDQKADILTSNLSLNFNTNIWESNFVSTKLVDKIEVHDFALIDFNQDSIPEILGILDYKILKLSYNFDKEKYDIDTLLTDTSKYKKISTFDFDNDGDLDIVTLLGEKLIWYQHDGLGHFVYDSLIDLGILDYQVIDLNGDGYLDIVASTTSGLFAFHNDGNQNFTSIKIAQTFQKIPFIVHDINNDNSPDILYFKNHFFIAINDNNNGFIPSKKIQFIDDKQLSFSLVSSIQIADMDHDNDFDIVFSSRNQRITVGILENTDSLIFKEIKLYNNQYKNLKGYHVTITDIDKDNDNDIILTTNKGTILLEHDLDEYIYNPILFSNRYIKTNTYGPEIVDIDLDGDLDIIHSGISCETLAWAEQCNEIIIEIDQTGCATYTSPSKKHTWNKNGIYKDTISHSTSCDTIIIINLTIVNSTIGIDKQMACDHYTWIDGKTYSDNNNTAIYTITNTSGCDSIVLLDLTIESAPKSTDKIDACNSYQWIDGNTYDKNNTTAIFSYPQTTGCDSLVFLDLTIHTIDNAVTKSSNQRLKAMESDASYQWLDCDQNFAIIPNAVSQFFTPKQHGSYAVEVSKNNCIDTSKCIEYIKVATQEIDILNQITISPNPIHDKLNINYGTLSGVKLEVFNIQGKLICKHNQEYKSKSEIVFPELPGLYFITFSYDNQTKHLKFIKQ